MLKDRYIVLVEDDEIMGGSLLQRLEQQFFLQTCFPGTFTTCPKMCVEVADIPEF